MVHFYEEVVKIYFEILGYIVRTNIRFRTEKSHSDIDLVIYNPKTLDQAIISVKGWNRVFYAYFIHNAIRRKGILSFISKNGLEAAEKVLNTKEFRRILILQRLPKSKDAANKAINFLKNEKVEIILFNKILDVIINFVKLNPDYPESDILELIRLLKIHDRIK